MKDYLIKDFSEQNFQIAFRKYFDELEIVFENWEELFENMTKESDNLAFLRMSDDNKVIGFIQFKIDTLKNWFFEEKVGLVREFWVDKDYRSCGHGSALLKLVEKYFLENNIFKSILTTDTAPIFYLKQGYLKDNSYKAINNVDVFTKLLK